MNTASEDTQAARIEVTPGSMRMSDYFLDTFVAPSLSKLTVATIPSPTQRDSLWLNKFIMRSALVTTYPEPQRAVLFNYLRRAEDGFQEYAAACVNFGEYAVSPRNTISPYFACLRHFERVVASPDRAIHLLVEHLAGQKSFSTNDQSLFERLRSLYDVTKHMRGNLPTDSTLPMWITNSGLQTLRHRVTFSELSGLLDEIGDAADRLLSQ